MAEIQHGAENIPHEGLSDETMLRHIAWCGVIVAGIACSIAWVANTVA